MTQLMSLLRLGVCIGLLLSSALSRADNESTVYMTSLEWPPYAGEQLPAQGTSVAVAKQIFAAMGYELKVDFFPWSHAVSLGLDANSKYLGYLPEYYDAALESKCAFSEVLGFSPLGVAQRKDTPVDWRSLDDIEKLPAIGVVRNYVNTAELDKRIFKGTIRTDQANSDLANIKKLNAKRVALIVIDQHVFDYLLAHDPNLKDMADNLEFHPKLLEDKHVFVCFKRSGAGKHMRDVFNQGLGQIKMRDFFRDSLR